MKNSMYKAQHPISICSRRANALIIVKTCKHGFTFAHEVSRVLYVPVLLELASAAYMWLYY